MLEERWKEIPISRSIEDTVYAVLDPLRLNRFSLFVKIFKKCSRLRHI